MSTKANFHIKPKMMKTSSELVEHCDECTSPGLRAPKLLLNDGEIRESLDISREDSDVTCECHWYDKYT